MTGVSHTTVRAACAATEADALALAERLEALGPEAPVPAATRPGISVLIPAYQAGAYVAEALESVFAQTVPAAEIIVVDDGNEDDTAEHAWRALEAHADAPCRAALVLRPHLGQAASRNAALACASCEWVFYLDADDVLEPDALEQLLTAAEAHPEAGMVCALARDFVSPELTAQEAAALRTNPEPYRRMLAGCTMARREVYERVGYYDETLPSSETAQWMLRMRDAGVAVHDIDVVTLNRRYHRNNFGRRSRRTQLESYMAIIKQRRAQQHGAH